MNFSNISSWNVIDEEGLNRDAPYTSVSYQTLLVLTFMVAYLVLVDLSFERLIDLICDPINAFFSWVKKQVPNFEYRKQEASNPKVCTVEQQMQVQRKAVLLRRREQMKRKQDFLENPWYRQLYGYRQSKSGFIDNWRWKEFPGLIPPISVNGHDESHAKTSSCDSGKSVENSTVYLDFAGAALPTQGQLHEIYLHNKSATNQIMGNPHSMSS